jgi:S1-C subfamily serine protease
LSSPQGIYVANVTEGTAAAEAGLQKGDVIVRLDGSIVKSTPELLERVGGKRPGDNLDIEYYRNGKLNKVQAKLRNREGNDKLMSKEEIAAVSFDQLGAVFENASPDVKRKMQINSGVVIKQIQAGSKLASVGVPEGFIITKLNKKEVNSVAEVKDIIKNNKGMIMMEGVMPGYNGKYYYTFN